MCVCVLAKWCVCAFVGLIVFLYLPICLFVGLWVYVFACLRLCALVCVFDLCMFLMVFVGVVCIYIRICVYIYISIYVCICARFI